MKSLSIAPVLFVRHKTMTNYICTVYSRTS